MLLQNCGEKPIAISTYPRDGRIGGSSGGDSRLISYYFLTEKYDDKIIVESPVKFQPVTLAPGETTLLPTDQDQNMVRNMAEEKQWHDSVDYVVSSDFADRFGWWSGQLHAPVTDTKIDFEKAPKTTPTGVTPARGVP